MMTRILWMGLLLARLGISLGVGGAYAIWAIWYRQVIRRRLQRLKEEDEMGPGL